MEVTVGVAYVAGPGATAWLGLGVVGVPGGGGSSSAAVSSSGSNPAFYSRLLSCGA